MKFTPEQFEKFAQILEKYDLAEVSFEEEDCQLHIVRKNETSHPINVPMHMPIVSHQQVPAVAAPTAPVSVAQQEPAAPQNDNSEHVKSPIVGTAYLAPEPGAPFFIKVGDKVEKDQVILIIEAMKVMNQLKAPVTGIIKEILVTNAKPVEFGEVLVKIQKS